MLREPVITTNPLVRFHKILGHLFFAVLLIYAIVYAVERIMYIDSAWLAFERINGETFSFPGDRYAAVFSEIILFIGTKLHLSLTSLIYLFSVSYIILYYAVWFICTYVLKNPIAGLVIIFGMFMGIREGFLHTVSETHQSFVYSALLFAVLSFQFSRSGVKYLLVILTTLAVLYCHPLGIFTALFALAYYFTNNKSLKDPLLWIVAAVIVIVALLNVLYPPNVYDESQYMRLAESSGIDALVKSQSLAFLRIHFAHFYWLPELAFVLALGILVFRKCYLKSLLLVIGVIGYAVVGSITFRNGDSSIMLERIYLPACFMINLALAEQLFQVRFSFKWIPHLLILFFIVNGIRDINAGCLMYKKRVAYLDELVQKAMQSGTDKYILSQENANMDQVLAPWALGVETLMYSKYKYDKCVSITMEPEGCDSNGVRLTKFLCLPVTDLNPVYFSLSQTHYQPLP